MSMFYLRDKLTARVKELANYRLTLVRPITGWLWLDDPTGVEKYPPSDWTSASNFAVGDEWKGRDRYAWVKTTIALPDQPELYVVLDFGKSDGGYLSGFEGLLFIDGSILQGVDGNHMEVNLTAWRGRTVVVAVRLWSGIEGGGVPKELHHRFQQASLMQRNPECDDLYYLSNMLVQTLAVLPESDPTRYPLAQALDDAFMTLDWRAPGSHAFFTSVGRADQQLNDAIAAMPKQAQVTITAVGHTHIDVAWLWRLKHTREKAARSFATVLEMMNEYPDYVFMQSQPQLYQYVKEDYPELFAQIKQRVAEGRWEADGSMWLEADCNIPSGESLTRQILTGSQFFSKEFGVAVHYLWLPDVFGYSWALPQILTKSGITTFMTTKISWNQYNRMPHDTFIWKGMDGSEVLTHFITTPDPEDDSGLEAQWYYTYNGILTPETVRGIYESYQDKAINHELLLAYGYGDGGGGVNREQIENRRRLDMIPGLPRVQTGKAGDYFARLHETIEKTEGYVHTWDGELYLEYHRGTYTAQAFAKRLMRKNELGLRRVELLYSLAAIATETVYPQLALNRLWRVLLRNQFHDIIPGSAAHDVYVDNRTEMLEIKKQCQLLQATLAGADEQLTIINTAGWAVTQLVTLPAASGYATATDVVPSCRVKGQTYALVTVPALGQVVLHEVQNAMTEMPLADVTITGLTTDRYILTWNVAGELTRIYHRRSGREILNGTGNTLQLFEDKPINYDAWNIDIFYQQKMQVLHADSIRVVANTPLMVAVVFTYTFGRSHLTTEMRLYSHTDRIDFVTNVDWHERQQLLKVKFDVNIRANEATYDIQYGNVKRPTNWNTSWEYAKFEVVGHQWADLSQHDFGVSLMNDCKYGYDIKNHTMRLSLLTSSIDPDPTADQGEQHFTYSLYPHEGDFVAGQTVQAAWALNEPLTVMPGKLDLPNIQLTTPAPVAIDALKRAEDGRGWILRVHDYSGGTTPIGLDIPGITSWNETNLMEVDDGKLHDMPLSAVLQPYEIRTFRLQKNSRRK